jgi:hypothetical protein
MRIRLPRTKVREKFLLTYELKGCQSAVDFLTKYYGVRNMRIVLNGRKVGNRNSACYIENKAYFKKKGLKKRIVLHELYHHLAYSKGLEKPNRIEEKEADDYAKNFLSCNLRVRMY